MKYKIFGIEVQLVEGVSISLELKGVKIGTVIKSNTSIQIVFLIDVWIGNPASIVNLLFKKDTRVTINLTNNTGTITNPVSLKAYQITSTLSQAILTPENEIILPINNPDLGTKLSEIALDISKSFRTITVSDITVTNIAPDLQGQKIDAFFKSDIAQIDRIVLSSRGESITFKQQLKEYRIFIDSSGLTKTILSPEFGYFPIHPDCFDLKELTVSADKSLAHIKFSFALVNGMLWFEKSFDNNINKFYWQSLDDKKPAILLFNFLDVNGFPVVLCPQEQSIPLLFRTGVNILQKSITDPNDNDYHDFQKTIRGISPASITGASLHTLAYQNIDWQLKEKQLYGQNINNINDINEALHKPYWLKKGNTVDIDETPPAILYGITKGTWLTRKQNAVNKADLESTAIDHQGTNVYHFISLNLQTTDWELRTQYEERETHLISKDASFIISERVFSADNDDTLNFPATDYIFGTSNIYQPIGLIESTIQQNIRTKINLTNAGLNKLTFFGSDQEHVQGFSRDKSAAEKLSHSAVFYSPMTKAASPLDVIAPPPTLAETLINFTHGSYKDKTVKAIAPGNTADDIADRLRKIQQIWNDYISLLYESTDATIKSLAEDVWVLRTFFENLSQETNPQATRVQFTLPDGRIEYYRIKFDTLAISDEDKTRWLQQVKNVINGDFNKIPGLGRRLNVIKETVQNWTIQQLETAWNVKWDVNISVDQKIIYKLLDFVYKQCDRTLLNQLLELVLLTELGDAVVTRAVKAAGNLLRYASIITGTTADEIKNEIENLKNDALKDVEKIITEAMQGQDPYFGKISVLWKGLGGATCTGVIASEVYARYGSQFDLNTYKRLINDIGSGDVPVKETAQKIMSCLERNLKNVIKDELVKAWKAQSRIWDDQLKLFIHKYFAQYEKDITTFYLFVLRVIAIKDKVLLYIALFNKIKNVTTAAGLIALSDDPTFKETYNLILDIVKEEYGDKLTTITTGINDKIRNEIDKHFEKIVSAATLIIQVQDQIKLWEEQIIPALRSSIEQLKTEWISFVDDFLQNKPDQLSVFLNLIINYYIEKYIAILSLPDLRSAPPEYLVYGKHISFNTDNAFNSKMNEWLKVLHLSNFKLCDLGESERQWNFSLSENSIYILKLGNNIDFAHILNEINDSNKKPGLPQGPFDDGDKGSLKLLIESLHPEITTKDWRGLLVVQPFADISNDNLIRDLLGKAHIKMVYAAVGGTHYEANAFPGLNVYARIKEDTPKMDVGLDGSDDAELTLIKFDAVIRNTMLESGNAILELDYNKFLGLKPPDQQRTVRLLGSVPPRKPGDDSPRDFEFGVSFHPPFELKNKTGNQLGFIEKVSLSGIRALRQSGRSVLDINALIKFSKFGAIQIVKDITLRNFYIILPSNKGKENPSGKPRGVGFDIGAIEFTINKPRPINFYGIELLPKAVGYWKNIAEAIKHGFAEGIMWIGEELAKLDPNEFSFLKVDIDFGKLPRLGGSISGSLKFDAYIGFKSLNGVIQGTDKPYFGVQGVTGTNISIDLFRFISLYIEKLLVKNATLKNTGDKVTFIGAKNVKLKILDWSPLPEASELSIAFLHNHPQQADAENQSPQKAFIAAYTAQPADGIIKIFWLLVAQNLVVDESILNRLISPAADNKDVDGFVKEIFESVEKPAPVIPYLAFDTKPGWLFGASFSIGEILDRCSLILHEDHYYGIMLSSKQAWFEELFGVDKFALSYIPGSTKQQDRFRVEFSLPKLDLISNLKAGMIALEYGVNRDFLADFGFPWRSGNTYLWYRSFSLISGIYETRFAFYFEKRTVTTPTGTELTIGAGVAISYGYGLRASVGFAYAEAGISITAILMGAVTFGYTESVLKSSIKRIEVTGVIGIYGYVRGGINYWIITAEIRAEIVAALAGHLIYEPHGNSALTFSATLSVKFAASARLKVGFIKITVRVSGHLDYGVSGRIALN